MSEAERIHTWVKGLSAQERAIFESIRDELRPTLYRIVQGATTGGDAYRVLMMIHEAGARAKVPPASWWGSVAHMNGAELGRTHGRCSWVSTPAGPFLRVELPAVSLPRTAALPEWTASQTTAFIAASTVLYYHETTEEAARAERAADAEALRREGRL